MSSAVSGGPSGGLKFKKKKKNDKKEKGVLECRPHLHAGFSTIGCLPLSETELLP